VSDEQQPAEHTAEPAEQQQPATQQQVPYDRFREVNEQKKRLEKTLNELTKEREEREQAGLSDLDRATKARQRAEERAAELEQRLLTVERSEWIKAAARNFQDPDDAVAFLRSDIGDLDSPEKAKDAVDRLAGAKPHLLRVGPSSGFDGGARVGQVPDVPRTADGQIDVDRGLGQDLVAAAQQLLRGRS
jgi:sugar-specific transcriptional regulator TrmB